MVKKSFYALEDYQQDILLKRNVYIDGTYYKVVQSKLAKKANGKEYASLYRNQICIYVLIMMVFIHMHLLRVKEK